MRLFVPPSFSNISLLLLFVVVREVDVRVLGKELELPSANGGRFEINQLYLQMIQH